MKYYVHDGGAHDIQRLRLSDAVAGYCGTGCKHLQLAHAVLDASLARAMTEPTFQINVPIKAARFSASYFDGS